jgi:hypothetical protein
VEREKETGATVLLVVVLLLVLRTRRIVKKPTVKSKEPRLLVWCWVVVLENLY